MNNKPSFLNKYFIITVILIIIGGVYYFKFYNNNDTAIDIDNNEATENSLVEDNGQKAVSENKAPVPKVTPKAPSASTPQTPPTQTILLKNNFVSIKNNAFSPSVIVIKRGTEITWTNEDNTGHKIAYNINNRENPLPELGSKILTKGQSYVFMFTKPGTYDYYCDLHPFMKGTIIVTEQ